MKRLKNDNRSKYTQSAVKAALIKLLATNSLNKITINALCEIADINRSTFYNNFYDVYDVLESIEEEFYVEVKEKLDSIKVYNLQTNFFKEIMNLIHNNYELVKIIILKDKSKSYFLIRIINYVTEKATAEFLQVNSNLPQEFIENVLTYTTNGSIGIILKWIEGGMKESTESIAQQIELFNNTTFRGVLAQ